MTEAPESPRPARAQPVPVRITRLEHGRGLPLPRPATAGSAGCDLAAALSEEHGVLQWAGAARFTVGERLRIVPNHCCVVSNLFDSVFIIEDGGEVVAQAVDARGAVT